MNEINDQLMNFQENLMEILYSNDDINVIRDKLAIFHHHPVLANWLNAFLPSMLEVAARMTQHWGKKKLLDE